MMKLHSLMMVEFDVVDVVRSVFVAGVVAGLFLNSVPFLKRVVVNYGSRAQLVANKAESSDLNERQDKTLSTSPWLVRVSSGVPHSWFVHYYVASVILSLFWGWQLSSKGSVFLAIASHTDTLMDKPSMSISQVQIVWFLMLVQGSRRLIESLNFMKTSASRMPWTIYLIGLIYYLNMSVAIWIEGTKAIFMDQNFQLMMPLPSIRTTVGLFVFSLASGIQHDCHAYLGSLPKYTLPVHPAFQKVVSPHYTAECVLYLALAFMAAPSGQVFNWTLLANFLFVLINLGLVADESKRWSEIKFGKEKVGQKARLIPHVW